MQHFVGRNNELNDLNAKYQSPNFEMIVIYGRRRVGKTALISEFIQNKPAIYYQGIESTGDMNLKNLSEKINDLKNDDFNTASYADFEKAFTEVQNIANHLEQKLVFVIDEYPFLARSEHSVSSILQYVIDHVYKKYNNVMLILCGSSMSFMERQVLEYKSPLYGRKTGQLKLEPFDLFESETMLPSVNKSDLLGYYGITGGIPQYLAYINPEISLRDNIRQMFFSPVAPLRDEPNVLMQEEMRNPATYNAILKTIANGSNHYNDIVQATDITSSSLTPYLKNLIDIGVIQKKQPLFNKNNRKAYYYIVDGLFRFWFKFVDGETDLIVRGQVDRLLDYIMSELPRFLGPVFEQASGDWLWRQNDLPIGIRTIGQWWGPNPAKKREEEIDIVAPDFTNNQAIIGECKWRAKDKIKPEMIDTLVERSFLVPKIKQSYLYFFAKEATPGFKAYAQKNNVTVIEYQHFFE
ncbi:MULTISPECIES: ATP-binding protein [unclassified Lactobacillus]|uniref:ATP-binding protein n=1 Tax=unclassified Lactobacillus TaxID=2620435 RepID=UPI000BEEF300|nr:MULTISPECIES: ATP-binding protein [unclassified Lactobacillus]PEG90879.1 ATPase [Lactobacillus sp. UMNPBX12]PEG92796.1 ATPase [Lactobacillus sp. UMNPBX11]